MKKLIVTLTALAVVGVAQADIYANLSAGFGIGGNGAAGGIVDPIDGTTVQLVLIGGGGDGLDYINGNQINVAGFTGNDTLLGLISTVVTGSGSDFSDWAGTINGDITAPNAADTWIRVMGVQNGDWVYEQAISFADLDPTDPLQLPEAIFFDNGGAGGTADGSVTVIPEPATIGLMGIAGLGMFLARKKARR